MAWACFLEWACGLDWVRPVTFVPGVIFAFLAACFWFASATVKIPKAVISLDAIEDAGFAYAVRLQTKRSRCAAVSAGLAAVCQGVSLFLTELSCV